MGHSIIMLNHSFERADSLSVDDGVAVENPQDMMDLVDAATWDGVVSMDGDTNNDNNNNNEEEERGDDGDWSSGSLSGTGILILPRGLQIDNNNNNNVNNPMSPMNLSLPSSVPSTMESLMLDNNNNNNNNPAPQPQVHDASNTDARTQPPPFQATNQPGQEQQQQQQQFRLASLLLGGCLMFLVTVTPTLYLIWERNEMRSTALRLAEQVQLLQVQVQQEQDKIRPKTTKPQPYTPPPPPPQPAGPPPSSPIFSWEASPPSSSSNCPDGTVLPKVNNQIDTCWVRANANFELGECAVETHKTVKKKLKKLGKKLSKTLWRAQEEFIIKMQDMKQQYADREAFFLDVFNKDNNDKSTFTDNNNNNKNSNKVNGSKNKNKERLHKIGKTATAVLSGVAFASAAALIISGSFLSNFVNDPEQDD